MSINYYFLSLKYIELTENCGWPLTIGLCDVGEFEILPPGTAAQLKY
jgi:hypothetical protein